MPSLKTEVKRKLAIYASYLPQSIFAEKKKEDPLLEGVESANYSPRSGNDPITQYEKQVADLTVI